MILANLRNYLENAKNCSKQGFITILQEVTKAETEAQAVNVKLNAYHSKIKS